MGAEEFLQSYFEAKQKHERAWEELWQRELRPFFGEYFLDRRAEADVNWATIPEIDDVIHENDDTTSFITAGEEHHTKRYYVTKKNGGYTIDRIMVMCEICDGEGEIEGEECELCDGRGWDDWLD